MRPDIDEAMFHRCQIARVALGQIVERLPSFSEDADAVWVNRMWNTEFRELQRIARKALEEMEKT